MQDRVIDNPDREQAEADFGCEVKLCRRCLEYLPKDADFFPRLSKAADGFNSYCKACWSEISFERYHRTSEVSQDSRGRFRSCSLPA